MYVIHQIKLHGNFCVYRFHFVDSNTSIVVYNLQGANMWGIFQLTESYC